MHNNTKAEKLCNMIGKSIIDLSVDDKIEVGVIVAACTSVMCSYLKSISDTEVRNTKINLICKRLEEVKLPAN